MSTSAVDRWRSVKIWTKNLTKVSNGLLPLIQVPPMIQNKTEILNLKTRKTQIPIRHLTPNFFFFNRIISRSDAVSAQYRLSFEKCGTSVEPNKEYDLVDRSGLFFSCYQSIRGYFVIKILFNCTYVCACALIWRMLFVSLELFLFYLLSVLSFEFFSNLIC
jgi:hypothetical protein